jgi:hypothetical protein
MAFARLAIKRIHETLKGSKCSAGGEEKYLEDIKVSGRPFHSTLLTLQAQRRKIAEKRVQ